MEPLKRRFSSCSCSMAALVGLEMVDGQAMLMVCTCGVTMPSDVFEKAVTDLCCWCLLAYVQPVCWYERQFAHVGCSPLHRIWHSVSVWQAMWRRALNRHTPSVGDRSRTPFRASAALRDLHLVSEVPTWRPRRCSSRFVRSMFSGRNETSIEGHVSSAGAWHGSMSATACYEPSAPRDVTQPSSFADTLLSTISM